MTGRPLHPRRVVYTVLIGRYETLNELTVDDPGITAICFTDDADLRSETWRIVLVEPAFPSDPVRSQRKLKVLGHPELDGFDEWMYIDNVVRLLTPPSRMFEACLAAYDLAIPSHSYRDTVEDEFEAVIRFRLDHTERVTEQLEHYRFDWPRSLATRPLWNGIILRRSTPEVAAWATTWWEHIMRYSRRDQLSVIAALMAHELPVHRIELDNSRSEYHEWLIATERNLVVRHVPQDREARGPLARILRLPRAARVRSSRVLRPK